jgi:hypothetical protein
MSFELTVVPNRVPPDLGSRWQQALEAAGLRCEFHPTFRGAVWPGGYLPIKVTAVAADSFPEASRYSESTPFICGFELDISAGESEGSAPESRLFVLRTAMGRSVADLRLQWFGAATLAILTGGEVEDPQRGENFPTDAALVQAAREADEYEERWAKPEDWDFFRLEAAGAWPA